MIKSLRIIFSNIIIIQDNNCLVFNVRRNEFVRLFSRCPLRQWFYFAVDRLVTIIIIEQSGISILNLFASVHVSVDRYTFPRLSLERIHCSENRVKPCENLI